VPKRTSQGHKQQLLFVALRSPLPQCNRYNLRTLTYLGNGARDVVNLLLQIAKCYTAYPVSVIQMTLSGLQGILPIASVFRRYFSYSCAAVHRLSTDIACRTPSAVTELLVQMDASRDSRHACVHLQARPTCEETQVCLSVADVSYLRVLQMLSPSSCQENDDGVVNKQTNWNFLPVETVDFSTYNRFRKAAIEVDFSEFLTDD